MAQVYNCQLQMTLDVIIIRWLIFLSVKGELQNITSSQSPLIIVKTDIQKAFVHDRKRAMILHI